MMACSLSATLCGALPMACLFLGWTGALTASLAETELLSSMPLGMGRDQLGVIAIPNTECRGPEAITFLTNNEFIILDSVNARLSRNAIGSGVQSLQQIPGASYPKDVLIARDGAVILDPSTGSVIKLSQSGDMLKHPLIFIRAFSIT
jgi:hypothetical protein